uniref:Family with sequence similarity 166 member A n=1 Tax=Anser cygnoides TaxID=8845 RepID=A0A8B9DXU4_ANSCY
MSLLGNLVLGRAGVCGLCGGLGDGARVGPGPLSPEPLQSHLREGRERKGRSSAGCFGYEGFVPQYNYQFGETYGKTTYRLLTDPHVRKSPRSVLAPLCKQRFIEDFSGTQCGLQPYLPGHPGERPLICTRMSAGLVTVQLVNIPIEKNLLFCPLAVRYPPYKIASKATRFFLLPEWCKTPGAALGGWWGCTGRSGAVEGLLPAPVERELDRGKLQCSFKVEEKGTGKRIASHYLNSGLQLMVPGFVFQFLQRHPIHSFGKRFPQTYWPNNRIYTGAGLIPSYTGFVPHLRHTYALTFGNSTRKAYRKEQRRRACAL